MRGGLLEKDVTPGPTAQSSCGSSQPSPVLCASTPASVQTVAGRRNRGLAAARQGRAILRDRSRSPIGRSSQGRVAASCRYIIAVERFVSRIKNGKVLNRLDLSSLQLCLEYALRVYNRSS